MKRILCCVLLAILLHPPVVFAEDPTYIETLAKLEMQDLMNQPVSSVLRKEQRLSSVAAAVYVITQEDIRRSASRNLPELLRMVPGLTVVRTGAGDWEVTARGFDTNGSSKLLVLIDGRSVYSPVFSGVFWDVQDLISEDIERIEVIRGPGAVSWGENAVNGVINIITKHAKDTTGLRAIAGGGSRGSASGSVTYGDKIGPESFYRVFTKYLNREGFNILNTGESEGRNDLAHGGFRMDSTISSGEALTFQGDLYKGEKNRPVTLFESFEEPFTRNIRDTTILSGGNMLFRWTHTDGQDSEVKVQGYYDRTNRQNTQFAEGRDTYDLDVQHHRLLNDTNDLIYGADFRVTSDSFDESAGIQLDPDARTDTLFNTFVQDEITVVPDTFKIIPGVKLGYNDYSQFDYQPALKALWNPTPEQTLWASVARAVRSPARIDEDITAYIPPAPGASGEPVFTKLSGAKGFDAEELHAFEVGYRTQVSHDVSADIATFYNLYDDLLSAAPGNPFIEQSPAPPHAVLPFVLNNRLNGRAAGAETYLRWALSRSVDISASYSYIDLNFSPDKGAFDPGTANLEKRTPNHQANFRAHWDVTDDLELNALVYFVDAIEAYSVPGYIRTDFHAGYRLDKSWRLDIGVQNATDPSHREWGTAQNAVEVDRTFFGKLTYLIK